MELTLEGVQNALRSLLSGDGQAIIRCGYNIYDDKVHLLAITTYGERLQFQPFDATALRRGHEAFVDFLRDRWPKEHLHLLVAEPKRVEHLAFPHIHRKLKEGYNLYVIPLKDSLCAMIDIHSADSDSILSVLKSLEEDLGK